MPHRCSIPLADLRALVAAGGGTWRHTALCATLVRLYGCHERTARLTLRRALSAGVLTNHGGWYRTADPEPDSEPSVRSPRSIVPSTPVLVSNSTARPHRVDRHRMLQLLQGPPSRYTDVISTLCDEFGCCQSTARANLNRALRDGYLERTQTGYRLTPEARHGLDSFGRLEGVKGVQFARFCSGRPGRRAGQCSHHP